MLFHDAQKLVSAMLVGVWCVEVPCVEAVIYAPQAEGLEDWVHRNQRGGALPSRLIDDWLHAESSARIEH